MKKEFDLKKQLFFSIIFSMILLFFVQSVIAQESEFPSGEEAGGVARAILNWFVDFFNAFLGVENGNSVLPFINIFMALILFSLVYSIIDSMGFFYKQGTLESSPMVWIVSIAVTALMLIAIVPSELFTVILPSYGAAGATILTVLPFLIIFWFSIKVRSPAMARLIWMMFSAYFVGSYVYAFFYGPLGDGKGGWLYLLFGVLGFIMILAMNPIRTLILRGSADEIKTDIEKGGQILAAFKTSQFEQAKAEADGAKALTT